MNKITQLVMDPEKNPLMYLPVAQRYQIMMVLSIMWTTIFTASLGIWYYYGALFAGHALVLTGIFITAIIFQNASSPLTMTYRDYPLEDGTARYDDVWGG
jgi:hypothetical protein